MYLPILGQEEWKMFQSAELWLGFWLGLAAICFKNISYSVPPLDITVFTFTKNLKS